MLARITYLLVIIALGCLIGGFFTRESNVLLFVSIGLSVVAIALVLVGWARRAREAPVGFDEDLAYADDEEETLLSDEELAYVEERPARRGARTKSAARPRTKPKAAKPKAKSKAKATPKSKATSKAKPRATSKAKPKPKATRKPQSRPKRKPPRPRPETP